MERLSGVEPERRREGLTRLSPKFDGVHSRMSRASVTVAFGEEIARSLSEDSFLETKPATQ